MDRKEFKQAVYDSLERKGCTRIKVDLSIFGLQGEARFHQEGFPFKREAHAWYKDKDGKQYLKFEAKDGEEWIDEL